MSASFEKMSSSVTLHLNTFHWFRHRPVMSVHKMSLSTLSPLCRDVVCKAFVSRTGTLIWCFSVDAIKSLAFESLHRKKVLMSDSNVFDLSTSCPSSMSLQCIQRATKSHSVFFVSCQSWWRSKATHRAFQSVMSSFNSTLRLNCIQSKLRCETLVWHR